MNEFSLITFNIFGRKYRNFYSINEHLEKYNPDVICTQEEFGKDCCKDIGEYKYYGTRAINGVYGRDNSLQTLKCISTDPIKLKGATNRYAIIFSYKNLVIANIHLEGGRYVDEVLLDRFDELMTHKMDLLHKVISDESGSDIIVGDFNSVYNTDNTILDKYLDGQYSYFEKKRKSKLSNLEKDNIKKWNLSPILYLLQHGYEYSVPKNENTAATSERGKTIVDFIFYKKEKIKANRCEIIDVMTKNISDHNPIIASFSRIDSHYNSQTYQPVHPSRVSIIGSAGRSIPKTHQTRETMEAMYNHCLGKLKTLPTKPILVSGGAAWADHLAVWLGLREGYSVVLHLPCEFKDVMYVDNGSSDWRTNPGKTANYYHRVFSTALGTDSLGDIQKLMEMDTTEVHVGKGFHERNGKVAKSEYMLAYTWGRGDEPDDGGTKHTWDLAAKTGCKRRHVSIQECVESA